MCQGRKHHDATDCEALFRTSLYMAVILFKGYFGLILYNLDKMRTLMINLLLETNLGMPYVYMIFIVYSCRFTE